VRDLLPGRVGSAGVTAADNRLFVEAVLCRFRTGVPWCDLPERFGDGVAVHLRFSRWAKSGVTGAAKAETLPSDGTSSAANEIIWCTGFCPALRLLGRVGILGTDGRVRVRPDRQIADEP